MRVQGLFLHIGNIFFIINFLSASGTKSFIILRSISAVVLVSLISIFECSRSLYGNPSLTMGLEGKIVK